MSFDMNKIKELYPEAEAMMFQPMLINKGTEAKLKNACESGEYFGQIKKDGAFYQFVKTVNYKYLFGRTVSQTTKLLTEKGMNIPHIMNALDVLPKNTILVGEIYYPGGTSRNVTSIMGCLPTKAVERQNGSYGLIHYYVHDILMFDGVNFITEETGAWDRYRILQKIWNNYGLNNYDFLELAESWTDNLYSRVGDSLAAGEEGMVIKKKDGKYEPGKRPMTNLKAKKVDFIDAIIIGFEKPTKEYYGQELETWGYNILLPEEKRLQGNYNDLCEIYGKENIVAVTKPYYYSWNNSRIVIGAYDDEGHKQKIGVIHSGISDEMKQAMSENPMAYLNNVCMIQCMELDKTAHTIRHGFFKGIREDKDEFDCTFKAIFT